MTKMKAEPATELCDDAQKYSISPVSQIDTELHFKTSTESIDDNKASRPKPRAESEFIDVDDIPPLSERLKSHRGSSSLEQQGAKSTHSECRAKPGGYNKTNLTYTSLVISSQHAQTDLNFLRTRKMHKKSSDTVGQFQASERERKQSVISEAEDPLMPYGDTKVGGAQGVTSSLQYQYCDSSDEESSRSDDDIPPLVDRIGSKRPGSSSSPLKSKLSPTKDLVIYMKSEIEVVAIGQDATKTNAKRRLGLESFKNFKDDTGGRNWDTREKAASKDVSVGAVGLSGTCYNIGSAESPIEID